MKAKVLYFNSKNEARLVTKEIEDGAIIIENKQFYVDNAVPLLLQTRFGVQPLYLLKWNEVEPARNINYPISFKGKIIGKANKIINGKGNLELVEPKWREKGDMTPDMLRKIINLRILGNMIKVRKPTPSGLLFLILGIVIGIGILYSLINFKLLPI